MKHFVNLIQLAVVAAIVFPIFYIWDTDKVDAFCEMVKPGMTKTDYIQLANDLGVKMLGPVDDDIVGGKWQASVVARTPFVNHICHIKGVGNKVATAKIAYDK